MKLSAQLTLVMSIVFAALCLGYVGYGWWESSAMPEGQARDDARGFVYFWLFLGAVGVASAIVSWLMARGTIAERGK